MIKAFNDSALEQTIPLVAGVAIPLDMDIPAAKLDFSKPSVLFVNPDLEGAAAITGTLTIEYMQFARAGANIFDGKKVEFKNFSNAAQGDYALSKNGDEQIVID